MNLPTCAVRARVYKQDGTPDVGARVVAVLNRFDTDDGYVGPTEVEAIADSTGTAILELWPNERGATESMYRVRIEGSERTLTTMAVVPDAETVDLEDIAQLPAYPGRTEGEIALAQMAVYVGQAQQAALDAAEAAEEAGDAARDAAEAAGDAARDAVQEYAPRFLVSPPVNPVPGAQWDDAETGRRFTWIVDADSGQWVETGASIQVGYNIKEVSDNAIQAAADAAQSADAAADSASAAAISEANAAGSAAAAQAYEQAAKAAIESFASGYTGFDDGHSYDFGYITDPMTYFNRDFGGLT